MKKHIKIVEQTSYEITLEEEINLIIDCLNYCHHRAVKHKTPMSGKEEKINNLRRQFGVFKN